MIGITPLHEGIGNLKVVNLLLDNGADFNVLADDGWKPLHYAYRNCNLDVIKALVNKGANINEFTPDGSTVLHCACSGWYSKILRLSLLKYLIEEKKMNVNLQRNWTHPHGETGGGTPFMSALHTQGLVEDFEILDYLIEKGADFKAKMYTRTNVKYNSVLEYAKGTKVHQFIIEWLITKGAR